MRCARGTSVPAAVIIVVASLTAPLHAADSAYLYGIHWWGYTSGVSIDTTPSSLLDAPTYGGWDVESILTHSDFWWGDDYFVPLYQHMDSQNMTIITRIDYKWGQTVPSPTGSDHATWPSAVVDVVNTLKNYSHIWIIGNEPNLTIEGENWPNNEITPAAYATIYRNVRSAIHSSAQSSPKGDHIVLIAAPSPGGAFGDRWMAGNDWLSQVIDNIPNDEIDGFSIHAYGNAGLTEFQNQYRSQLALIDNKGLADAPVYMTEWGRSATPGNATEEAVAAQFLRDGFLDVKNWNATAGNHNVICMCWFIYDQDQQAANNWNRWSLQYWRTAGNALGNSGNLYTAFEETVDLRYPAGSSGGGSPGGGDNMLDQVPTGTNLAANAIQVVADTENSGSETAAKVIDGVISSGNKWTSTNSSPPHWVKLDLGCDKVVNGYRVHHASAGGESTTYNTQNFQIQASTTFNGPWTDQTTVDNTSQVSVTNRTYSEPQTLRYIRLYITDPGVDNHARIPEFQVFGEGDAPPPPPSSGIDVVEDFESQPAWDSTHNATWGGAATFSVTSQGQAGNGLKAERNNAGSSVRARVYTISANTDYTLSLYIRCPSHGSSYWAESAYRLGSHSAADFDNNPGNWTMIKKFSSSGTNGNGDVYTKYEATFNSSSSTQITLGYKLGSGGSSAPVIRWDTLRITSDTVGPPNNNPPTAVASATPSSGNEPLQVSFSGSSSSDPDGNTLTYDWDFGDGFADFGVSVSHTYVTAGVYTATLTVNDGNGGMDADTVTITVNVPPPPPGGGDNLLTNPSFENGFTNQVANGWTGWSTAGNGYWKQSSRLGRIGSGIYSGTSGFSETVRLNPKVILCSDLATGHIPALRAQFPDAFIIGRLFIDHLIGTYLTNPEFYGAKHADDCLVTANNKPGASAWQGSNENFNSLDLNQAKLVARFEKAFADRCRQIGLKSVVMNIAVGNPGDISFMELDEVVDALAAGDYVGYHSYGGNEDQLMIGPQDEWFSLRWRKYIDIYKQNGWRMPPVVYTECTTFDGWHGVFTQEQIRDDLIAFEAETKPDPWSMGMAIFLVGSVSSQWDVWEVVGQPRIYEDCGDYNFNHPADAMDGVFSQQFGESSGGFTGGIVQAASTTASTQYRLDHWMKYETYGVSAALSYNVGYDLTGQTSNPNASTIVWSSDLNFTEARETDWWYFNALSFTATGSTTSIWFRGSQSSGFAPWRVMIDGTFLEAIGGSSSPTIAAEPAGLLPTAQQGTNAPSDAICIQNIGGGTLNYTVTDNVSWLSVNPASGASSGEVDMISVDYTTSGLSVGTYYATISITDSNATNSPQTVAVTLSITSSAPQNPTIALAPGTLNAAASIGNSPPNQSFTVANSGLGTLNYSISDNVSWLSVSPSSGTSTGEADTITVTYSTSGLSSGTHNATITVSDSNATNNPQTIAVTVNITAPFSGLANGNFEGGSFNDPDADHKTGNSWTRFSISGSSKSAVPWIGGSAHSPNYVQEIYEASWVAGIYQQVSGTTSGVNYTASAWVWGSSNDARFWIGIDPTGGTSATSSNIQWSSMSTPGTTWTQISKQVQASNGTITVFIKAENPWGAGLQARIDDAGVSSP